MTRFRPFLAAALVLPALAQSPQPHKTRNVLFVMADGLRWQEVFGGAEAALLDPKHSDDAETRELKRLYWRDTAAARRETLMPFLWTAIAKQGQIYGNREAGSEAAVTNGFNFSYPGYNEILTGAPDPRVDSNDKKPNPNVTVLEWLNGKPSYAGKVAAFGAWNVFPYIFNAARSGLPVNAGYDALKTPPVNARIELLNRLRLETGQWPDEPFDAPVFLTALEYLKLHQPRVLYLSLGETDEWAHDGKYPLYLKSIQRTDQYLKELWETVQSMPHYRGTTSLIVGVDHGRGLGAEWRSHGQKIPESKYVWMAFLGPDTPPLGERSKIAPVTESQVAATLAALLGENYNAAVPQAGKAITDAVH